MSRRITPAADVAPRDGLPTAADLALEARIEAATFTVRFAAKTAQRREALDDLRTLIARRTPAQVARLERAKGLRP